VKVMVMMRPNVVNIHFFKIHHSIEDIPVNQQFSLRVTGITVALHCCKAHAEINRKMGNLTPCKVVTPNYSPLLLFLSFLFFLSFFLNI